MNKMHVLLLALVFGVVRADPFTGAWHTLGIGSDVREKTSEGGPLRLHLTRLWCHEDCRKLTLDFFLKENGICKDHTVVATRTENGDYLAHYSGENRFRYQELSDGYIALLNVNVDRDELITQGILLAGKGRSPSQEAKDEFEELAVEWNVPRENIEYFNFPERFEEFCERY